jgi:DNA-directed RNA polymerase subunit RPC12/RpoP
MNYHPKYNYTHSATKHRYKCVICERQFHVGRDYNHIILARDHNCDNCVAIVLSYPIEFNIDIKNVKSTPEQRTYR